MPKSDGLHAVNVRLRASDVQQIKEWAAEQAESWHALIRSLLSRAVEQRRDVEQRAKTPRVKS